MRPFLTQKIGTTYWALHDSVTRYRLARVDVGPIQAYAINEFELAEELLTRQS